MVIRPPFALPPELGWLPLLREPMVLAAPAAAPQASWRELLSTQPFIRYDRASFGGRAVDRFLKKHRIHTHEAVELDEIEAIAGLVRTAWAWRCCRTCAAWTKPGCACCRWARRLFIGRSASSAACLSNRAACARKWPTAWPRRRRALKAGRRPGPQTRSQRTVMGWLRSVLITTSSTWPSTSVMT
ncbi:hypothetical protein AD428_19315 [Achromobacter sp. DMS1]|nr:hypothetical protein AD428_19315 [Achromobacter sp. DMS1]